ncbi:MAG: chemotaxis protein CheB [Actinomycetota bacterium]|nr:chemotaxis protein CheB [Actinomycetota bacterium]
MDVAPPFVIALVGSTGGLAAVTTVLEDLPADVPAAVLVLLHQTPDHVSRLAGILDRRCSLPVTTAAGGDALQTGRVLVAPSGKHLLITHQETVALIVSGVFPPSRPSADLLLTTLATACRERAVAVVLSGNGHDGATGAAAVHDFGGTVIASDEATSEVFAMPDAAITRDHVVDFVLPLDQISAGLVARTTGDR